jgi:hypothetical protein
MESEGIDIASPLDAIRSAFRAGVLDEEQARRAMAMASDRNQTVHTYSAELAARLFARMTAHSELLQTCLTALEKRAEQNNDDTELSQ